MMQISTFAMRVTLPDGSPDTSINREAIKQSSTTRAHQIVLAAAAAGVGGIPRSIVRAAPVKMYEPGRTSSFACPVIAGVIHAIRAGSAFRLQTDQHGMDIRSIATQIALV
jgi:hypothetical protein